MSDSTHSLNWYRVAELRPELRAHLRIARHVYAGEVWFVLHDSVTGRNHRFSPTAHWIISQMDGRATIESLWEAAALELGDAAPTQDEFIGLLAQLHHADALLVDAQPDTLELFSRRRERAKSLRWQRFGNPLAVRIALWNPDAFLSRTEHWVRPLFGRIGAAVWVATVLAGAVTALLNWGELAQSWSDRLLAPGRLVMFAVIYPLIKALHEFGHAYAAKVRGAEVREMGVFIMLAVPVPYVDASAASVLADKRDRMLIGAAGIAVEVFIAALAMLLWAAVEPGLTRAAAYSVMLIAGVSTVMFNGNPLLRYDGYYVLADALEIPNLAARANRQVLAWTRRRIFGIRETRPAVEDRAAAPWLAAYAIASGAYRVGVGIAILSVIAGKSLFAAAAIGAWIIAVRVIKPCVTAVRALLVDPQVMRRRTRILAIGAALAGTMAVTTAVVPMPLSTTVQGVVWSPLQSELRAGVDGTVVQLLAQPGGRVAAGDALVELSNPSVPVRVAAAAADLGEIDARYAAARIADPVRSSILESERAAARKRLTAERERAARLVIRSPADGLFVVARPGDLPGRFLRQGDRVGFVVSQRRSTVIAAVPQEDIGLVRSRTLGVAVRLIDRPGEVYRARVDRQFPAAGRRLPSAALGRSGGGPFALGPADTDGTLALDPVFEVELSFDQPPQRLGSRVFVRFSHGSECLLRQWNRRLRQLFLRRFDA